MEQVIKIIKNTKKAVLLPHINADADALASCMAMRCVLSGMGIAAEIYAEEPTESRLDFICKDIFVYDGTMPEFDTCIALDCGDIERVGKRAAFFERADAVVNIDHHRTNTNFGNANLVMADASATGEVLFGLFGKMGIEITDDTAKYLYTAICSDTGGFAYSNVSPQTFRIAAELIEHNINHAEISRMLFDCVDMEEELLKAELVKNVKSYYGGKVRTLAMSAEFAERFGISPDEIDGLVDIPRRIRGTEIAVSLKENGDKIRVSLRSNGSADVSAVALKFNGGGHIKAAGCGISEDIKTAETLIVKACEEVL